MILLLPLGAILGFSIGGTLCAIAALLLSIPLAALGIIGALIAATPLVALFGPLAGTLSPAAGLLLFLLSIFIVVVGAYALATVGLLGPIAVTPLSPTTSSPLPASALELLMRGILIGHAASINFAIWSVATANPGVGAFFALVTIVAALIPGLSAFVGYQFVLGWLSWTLPMSYLFLVMPLGFLLFLFAAPAAIAASGFAAIRFDLRTCTFETTGGAVITLLASLAPAAFTGFNLGNFTFLNLPPTVPPSSPSTVQGSFVTPSISSHETGHTLNLAVFGGAYHWTNAVDENLGSPPRRAAAYGELTAESHAKRVFRRFVAIW